jgi:hypothetical protein
MLTGAPEPIGQVVPLEENANGRQSDSSLLTIDVGRQMAEMERLLRPAGNHTLQMEALATLRRWQFDPRLDSASRQRASALVWKFQPNGWDEV